MADTVSVAITADVSQLRAQLAVAQADLRAYSAEVRTLAAASRTASDETKGNLLVQLEGAATKSAAAKAEVKSLSAALVEGASHAGSFSTAAREFRAAFDEISGGRTRMLPGTLAIIGQRVFGLQPAMLAAAGAAIGLTGALVYLTIRAEETARAIDDVQVGAAFAGNMDLSRAQIRSMADEMAHMAGVSDSAALTMAATWARIKGSTTPEMQALSALIGDYAKAIGISAEKASGAVAKSFSDPLKEGVKFIDGLASVTQAQKDAMQAAIEAGNAYKVESLMIEDLNIALGRARPAIDASGLAQVPQQTTRFQGILAHERAAQIQQRAEDRRKQQELVSKAAHELANRPETPENVLQLGMEAGARENPKRQEIERVTADIGRMSAALAQARSIGDEIHVKNLNADLKAAQEHLKTLEKPPHVTGQPSVMAGYQEQLAQMHAAFTGSRQQELEADRSFWQHILATAKLSAADRVSVERQVATTIAQIRQQQLTTARQIAQQDVATNVAIAKADLEAKKSTLQERLAAGQITNSQELADRRRLVDQEYQLDLKELSDQLATLNAEPVEYNRVYNQIRKLKAQHIQEMAALDRQAAAAQKRDRDTTTKQWEQSFQPISRAFDQSIQGMVMGTQTWQQAIGRSVSSVLGEFIASDAKRLTHWIATQLTELQVQTATDAAKTASTAGSTAAGLAMHAAASKTSVLQNAYSAAAAVYNDVAQIPYVGWVLAPPAAAAAFAGVAAFGAAIPSAAGGYDVPNDTLAMIHQREVVLPANLSDAFRAGAAAIGGGGGAGGAVQANFSIQALDASSVRSLLMNQQSTVMRMIENAARTGNSSLTSALSKRAA